MVERKHKHLLEVTRALLFKSKIPLKYWGECVLIATYLINRFLSKVLHNKSTYEVLFGSLLVYFHLKTFGCLCYALIIAKHKDKFQLRAKASAIIGYPLGKKSYKFLDLTTT